MTCLDARQADDVHHVGIQVQLIAQLHVERLKFSGSTEVGSCQNAFQADLVLSNRRDHILER